jgi:hypothetical protein
MGAMLWRCGIRGFSSSARSTTVAVLTYYIVAPIGASGIAFLGEYRTLTHPRSSHPRAAGTASTDLGGASSGVAGAVVGSKSPAWKVPCGGPFHFRTLRFQRFLRRFQTDWCKITCSQLGADIQPVELPLTIGRGPRRAARRLVCPSRKPRTAEANRTPCDGSWLERTLVLLLGSLP